MARVVLCDDHTIVREGVRRLLEESNGFDIVGEAADGFEALKLAIELLPDVLVTDFRMPGMDGAQLTRKVKECTPATQVVVLSMYGAEAYVYRALSAGASGYVLKDSGIQQLSSAIHMVLRGRRYLSPPITEEALEAYGRNAGKAPLPWEAGER